MKMLGFDKSLQMWYPIIMNLLDEHSTYTFLCWYAFRARASVSKQKYPRRSHSWHIRRKVERLETLCAT